MSGRARLLFVYGTLLRGERAHHLLSSARFEGEATTRPEYALCDLGAYPALLRGGSTAVHGELYATPAPLLAELDTYEGHPHLFRRGPVRVVGHHRVHAYFLGAEQVGARPRIGSGRWRARGEGVTGSAP